MADWAIEKASLMFSVARDNLAEESNVKIISRLAFDLRKAKADGLREAAEIIGNRLGISLSKSIEADLRDRADRIERGDDG